MFCNWKSSRTTAPTEPRLSPRFSANTSTVIRPSNRINSSIFSKFSLVDAARVVPGRWRLFFNFWKSPLNRRNFFGRGNCRHAWDREAFCDEFLLCSLRVTKKPDTSQLFSCGALQQWSRNAGRAFFVYCERSPNVDHISRRAKIDADTATNRYSQNNPCRKLIQISSLHIGWPSCIDIFRNPVRVCVFLFNATGRIFHPQMLYCFRNSISGLNISGPLDVGYTGRRNRNGLLSWLQFCTAVSWRCTQRWGAAKTQDKKVTVKRKAVIFWN